MSSADTSTDKRDRHGMTADDWKRVDAMTDEEINAAALSDPDAQPISPERLAAAKEPSLAKKVRHKLRMGRESFSAAYGIPLDKLIAWERHQLEPTEVELAYLRLIERQPVIAKLPEPAV